MAEILKVTSKAEFDTAIAKGNVFVDFSAPWCGPCKMLAPLVHDLASMTDNVTFIEVNVDENQDIAMEYQVMSIPTLLNIKDGAIDKKHVGFMAKNALVDFIK